MGNSPKSRQNYNQRRREKRAGVTPEPRKIGRPPVPVKHAPDFKQLIASIKACQSFEGVCDHLDMSPNKVKALISEAKEAGYQIRMNFDSLDLSPEEQLRTIHDTRILPTTGERQVIGHISDTHFGSKYCLREQIKDCVHHMYDRGIRQITHSGDWLDGCYKHGTFEISHVGIDAQTQDLLETLPQLPGLTYHGISGNHCETFSELVGVNVGKYIENAAHRAGRDDIKIYGSCSAFLEIKGAIIHLWHPLGSMSYAKSYKLQKQVEKYGSGEKPHILLGGHCHQFAVVEDRGVFAVLTPCFQASGSAFSKRLGGHPALGGLIISWEIAGEDTVRNFAVERRRYFEVEIPQKIKE